jgi:GT2 family glycosyltransferase
MDEFPKVSIVIVNLNGKHHLSECFNSILKLHYPKDKIEVVLIDNGSTDGSVEFVTSKYEWVKLICNTRNEGFAKPSNDGARAATGEYVAFLNNDMRVQRDWLIELVNSIKKNNAQCAGSVILNWNGKLLDFAGGSFNFFGMGYQFNFGRPLSEVENEISEDKELLFACGGSMLVERSLFLEAGGFDEDFFAYFEDADFGWRFRLLGYKTVLSAKSRVFHKHHSTANTFNYEKMDLIFNRNSLFMIYKNYSEEILNKTFWPVILMNYRFLYDRSGLNKDDFDLTIKSGSNEITDSIQIPKLAASKICAMQDFITNLPKINEKRKFIQSHRKVSDDEIFKFIGDPLASIGQDFGSYDGMKYEFAKLFGIDKAFGIDLKRTVLLVSSDHVATKMAGPAIRYWETAKVFADNGNFNVILACLGDCEISYPGIKTVVYTLENYAEMINAARVSDIVMVQGFILDDIPKLRETVISKYVIVDVYDPFMIENIEVFKEQDIGSRRLRHSEALDATEYQLKMGDFFVCANEKQRDYWIGMLSAYNRINPMLYDVDRTGEKLIGLMPFGISDKPPVHSRNVLKGVRPGIKENDKVIIWGGGVWNWFDPLTLVRAMKIISEKRSDIKLFFMGVTHPNPAIPKMKMLSDAVDLSKALGIYDKNVFFNFGWVDYDDRQNYLLEADIGVSCHFKTLETRFSFRTRILDYLWADLPIVCTKGDYFADLVESARLGKAVDFEDENMLAETLIDLLDNKVYYKQCKENIEAVANEYKWSKVVQPIVEFCQSPRHLGMRKSDSGNNLITGESHMDENEPATRGRRNSISGKLQELENRQKTFEKTIVKLDKTSKKTYETVREIEKWSLMMNERFNKAKKLMNPVQVLRRIFRSFKRR